MTRIVTLVALLTACDPKAPTLAPGPHSAGGEASEFGGSLPLGYCPIEESVTSLPFDREDVAPQLALAAGQHSVDLRWRKEFPDPAIRGFDENTQLIVNVTPLAAEDVVCRTRGAGGYEEEGVDGSTLRRFQLGIELSTTDGAVRAEFSASLYPVRDGTRQGQPTLSGGASLPLADVAGTLEIGVDAASPSGATLALDHTSIRSRRRGRSATSVRASRSRLRHSPADLWQARPARPQRCTFRLSAKERPVLARPRQNETAPKLSSSTRSPRRRGSSIECAASIVERARALQAPIDCSFLREPPRA